MTNYLQIGRVKEASRKGRFDMGSMLVFAIGMLCGMNITCLICIAKDSDKNNKDEKTDD